MTKRTDAKGQQTRYEYDAYGRLRVVRHFVGTDEQLNQRVDYS